MNTDQARAYMCMHPGRPVSTLEIAEALGISRQAANNAMTDLRRMEPRRLEKPEQSVWRWKDQA